MSNAPRSVGLLFLLLMIGHSTMQAAPPTLLLVRDYAAKGDGLITYDKVTKLEWLDLKATAGLRGDDILSGAGGWVMDGFRYATAEEITVLFLHAGLGTNYDVWMPELYAPARDFLSLIGAIRVNENGGFGPYSEAAGVYRNQATGYPMGMSMAFVATIVPDDGSGPLGYVQHRETLYGTTGDAFSTIGHWLVRSTNNGCR